MSVFSVIFFVCVSLVDFWFVVIVRYMCDYHGGVCMCLYIFSLIIS